MHRIQVLGEWYDGCYNFRTNSSLPYVFKIRIGKILQEKVDNSVRRRAKLPVRCAKKDALPQLASLRE